MGVKKIARANYIINNWIDYYDTKISKCWQHCRDIKPIWEGQGGTKGQKFARASCADYFYIITYLKNKIQMLANLIITMKLVSLQMLYLLAVYEEENPS